MANFLANLKIALTYGGKTAVVGMLIVFTGLIILILAITVMALIFKQINDKKEKQEREARQAAEAAAKRLAEAQAKAEQAAPEPEVVSPEDDPQLIAVIAAALAVYTDSGKPLVVRRVRRVPAWRAAARSELVV